MRGGVCRCTEGLGFGSGTWRRLRRRVRLGRDDRRQSLDLGDERGLGPFPRGQVLARSAFVEVSEQLLGRQRGEVSGFSRDDGVQQPFLFGQQLGRIFVLVVQCGVEGVEFFVEFLQGFHSHSPFPMEDD